MQKTSLISSCAVLCSVDGSKEYFHQTIKMNGFKYMNVIIHNNGISKILLKMSMIEMTSL